MIRDLSLRSSPVGGMTTLLLALLLLWAPLPFGSVTYEARAGLAAACALLLVLVLLEREPVGQGARLPALSLLLIAGWGLMQSAPLPGAIVRALSPRAWALRQTAARLVGEPSPARAPLSVAADLSRHNAIWWAAMAAAMLVAASCGRSRLGRRLLGLALLLAAAFQVLYGAQAWTRNGTIWGVEVPGGGGARLRGTYVNPDHLALLLEMPLAIAFAWIGWAVRRARERESIEARILLAGPPVLAWLGLFAAVAFTGSRAGLLAAVVATGAQGVAAAFRRRSWKAAPAAAGLVTLGIATVAAVGLQQGLGRWLATSPYELTWSSRRIAYACTFELWQRFPWTGVGMSAFRDAFPMVQRASIPGLWWHAHNDWVEALATLGVPGAVLLLVGIAALVQRLFRVLLGDNRSEDRAAALAAYGALVAVAVHSTLDFGLTIPANALALAVLTGAAAGAPIAISAKASRRSSRTSPAEPPPLAPDRDGGAADRARADVAAP